MQKKPAVEHNQTEVRKHKQQLIKTTQDVIEEMMRDLTYPNFTKNINDQSEELRKYELLKEQERELTVNINNTTSEYKKL